MEDKADDILRSFSMTDTDLKKHQKVKEWFGAYFAKRKKKRHNIYLAT